MAAAFDGIVRHFVLASTGFDRLLRAVRPGQWESPTPCPAWSVRALVGHMTGGNLNYVYLLHGGTASGFLRRRDLDALGADPVRSYRDSVRECADAYSAPGALARVLDYPLGRAPARQLLAVRTADTTIHAWDLARAIGAPEALDTDLVAWLDRHFDEIYAGLAESPVDSDTTHRFFAAPVEPIAETASRQERVLRRMGRLP